MIVGPMRCICTRDPGDLYPSRFSVRFRTCSAPREGVSEHPHPDPEHREHILGTCLLGVRRPIVFWMKGGGSVIILGVRRLMVFRMKGRHKYFYPFKEFYNVSKLEQFCFRVSFCLNPPRLCLKKLKEKKWGRGREKKKEEVEG